MLMTLQLLDSRLFGKKIFVGVGRVRAAVHPPDPLDMAQPAGAHGKDGDSGRGSCFLSCR
jgi:hypothetical protein